MAPKRKKSIEPLDDCIKRLVTLPRYDPSMPSNDAALLYASALAFIQHLSVDQETISHIRNATISTSERHPFPKPEDIPAMSAVVHDQLLFQSFIGCLKSTTETLNSNVVPHASSNLHASLFTPGVRMRNHSIDFSNTVAESLANKSAKLTHGQSPHAAGRRIRANDQHPQMDVRVLAATFLYIAFEPLDHWPVPLMEAYAEDSFGARTWVDHPVCQALVQNLELINFRNENDNKADDKIKLDADGLMVAEFYRRQNEKARGISPMNSRVSNEGAKRRGSLSSTATTETGGAQSLVRRRSESTESADASKRLKSSKGQAVANPRQRGKPSNSTKRKLNGIESDSGDDDEVAKSLSCKLSRNGDGSSSSSSGEDEEVIMEEMSVDGWDTGIGEMTPRNAQSDLPSLAFLLTYPFRPDSLKNPTIRQRYFNLNRDYAYKAVSDKLAERLEIKTKQSSGLLQCLPSFTTIPGVRTIITANLERWLQSPALAGLARNLFSVTVNNMRNTNPPLQEDLETLDNILSMMLKANQLNAHVENVTAIATRIPTAAIANHIYSQLLEKLLQSMERNDSSFGDHMTMIHAVHGVLPSTIQAKGIALSLRTMLIRPPFELGHLSKTQLVRRICSLIRSIANKFGMSFDPLEVMRAFLSFNADSAVAWTIEDEENNARLLFQCAILIGDPSLFQKCTATDGIPPSVTETIEKQITAQQQRMRTGRYIMLRWCCSVYAPLFQTSLELRNADKMNARNADEIVGIGPTTYRSVLDGLDGAPTPHWLKVARCVLFMEKSDSMEIRRFLSPDCSMNQLDWNEDTERIDLICDYGADLDNEMVWIVLNNATLEGSRMPREMALLLLEHMFHCCSKARKPTLFISDPTFLWKIYDLAEFIPPASCDEKTFEDGIASERRPITSTDLQNPSILGSSKSTPRLAHSGLWWRTTVIALVMCGASPENLGAVAWTVNPTLNALIKMVTSDRYRFPTVDCDDMAREKQKRTEQSMREKEARIAEMLFFRPKNEPLKKKEKVELSIGSSGSRTSRRMQEKRSRLQKEQRETEKAEDHAKATRRKKQLRSAQKSISLLDPKEGPRKPPKESADLIFSVGDLFDLPTIFQKCTQPDFILLTIGSTFRSAIERAYDWLIPIVSFLPETISRLPASASCFLLLRAYGTQGHERSQLQQLSAPLLHHIHDSLVGKFGEADALRAFDLLLTDLASHKPDRRRCARRVLQNAIGETNLDGTDKPFSGSNHTWVASMTGVRHARSIVAAATSKLATAASFERGSNLRYLVLGLHRLTCFASQMEIPGDWDFSRLLACLISKRPLVFAAALNGFSDLCSIAIDTVAGELRRYMTESQECSDRETNVLVEVMVRRPAPDEQIEKTFMPLSLLQSCFVLLSIWCKDDSKKGETKSMQYMVELLMSHTTDKPGSDGKLAGLGSAKVVGSGESAVPVESWVMLAKARSDLIGKQAALMAPMDYLPRLLLCSGLPRSSLITIVDRLGRLGDEKIDTDNLYEMLLISSASSEWDVGRLGPRRDVMMKLLGRISAYFRMYGVSGVDESVSISFYVWLSKQCSAFEMPVKSRTKKLKRITSSVHTSVDTAKSLLLTMPQNRLDRLDKADFPKLEGHVSEMTVFRKRGNSHGFRYPEKSSTVESIGLFFKQALEENKPKVLDSWLKHRFSALTQVPRERKRGTLMTQKWKIGKEDVSLLLLRNFVKLERKAEDIVAVLVSWIPRLTSREGSPKLWTLLFAGGQTPSFFWENLMSRCMQTWEHQHIIDCRAWLLSEGRIEKLDARKVAQFITDASSSNAALAESCFENPAFEDSAWARSERTVRAATFYALESLVEGDCELAIRSRNNLPTCTKLLLLIAKRGRNQVRLISRAIVERITKEDDTRNCLLLSLLRVYSTFPFTFNLGVTELRDYLTEAVQLCANDWLSWKSPLDDTLQDTVDAFLSHASGQWSTQALISTAKKHPLLLLRKLDRLILALRKDAFPVDQLRRESSAIVSGQALGGSLVALVNEHLMTIHLKYWGYCYTEYRWLGTLEVISGIPNEVLFGCALSMGLTDLLSVYIELFFIQTQLRTSDRLSKLKERFCELLGAFKSHNPDAWGTWVSCSMPEFPTVGTIQDALMACGMISQEDAMQSINASHPNYASKK